MYVIAQSKLEEIKQDYLKRRKISLHDLVRHIGSRIYQHLIAEISRDSKVMIICGNNHHGLYGLEIAKYFLEDKYDVNVYFFAHQDDLGIKESRYIANHMITHGNVKFLSAASQISDISSDIQGADIVIDALMGPSDSYGLYYQDVIRILSDSDAEIISIDIPSGLDGETGKKIREVVQADKTLVIDAPKTYLFQNDGVNYCGEWKVIDMELNVYFHEAYSENLRLAVPSDLNIVKKKYPRDVDKRKKGHLLVIAGSNEYRGSASLVVQSAFESDIGMVTLASVDKVCDLTAYQIPETTLLPCGGGDHITLDHVEYILEKQESINAAVIGPGLTRHDEVLRFLEKFFSHWKKPCVLDSDALQVINGNTDLPSGDVVLLSTADEMVDLLSVKSEDVHTDRFDAISKCVHKYHCTTVLKGPYSLIHSLNRKIVINPVADASLAVAGSGDRLSGIIGAYMGRGIPSYESAICGVWKHSHKDN